MRLKVWFWSEYIDIYVPISLSQRNASGDLLANIFAMVHLLTFSRRYPWNSCLWCVYVCMFTSLRPPNRPFLRNFFDYTKNTVRRSEWIHVKENHFLSPKHVNADARMRNIIPGKCITRTWLVWRSTWAASARALWHTHIAKERKTGWEWNI